MCLVLLAVPMKLTVTITFYDFNPKTNALVTMQVLASKSSNLISVHKILFIHIYANNCKLWWIRSLEVVNIKLSYRLLWVVYLSSWWSQKQNYLFIYTFIWSVAESKGIVGKRVHEACERRIWRSFLHSTSLALVPLVLECSFKPLPSCVLYLSGTMSSSIANDSFAYETF